MKRVCFPLLLFLLLFPVLSYTETDSDPVTEDHGYTAARETADILEAQYGITILIGPECNTVTTDGFTIGDSPEARTLFLGLLGGYNYESELSRIADILSVYPAGFFSCFQSPDTPQGLRLLLVNQILYEGESMAGVVTIDDGYNNIFLGVGAFDRLNIHHEIWHAMEYRITAEYPAVFDDWYTLNPEDFLYNDDNFDLNNWEQAAPAGAFFVRGYSTVDEYEDRATVFEAMFRYDQEWWDEHPYIRKKLDRMTEAAQPLFGTLYEEGKK